MDPGLAPERTALAWQRTALAIMFGTLVLARLTVGRIGPIALAVVAVSIPLSLWVFQQSNVRYDPTPGSRLGGGKRAFAVTLTVLLAGGAEAAALLIR